MMTLTLFDVSFDGNWEIGKWKGKKMKRRVEEGVGFYVEESRQGSRRDRLTSHTTQPAAALLLLLTSGVSWYAVCRLLSPRNH